MSSTKKARFLSATVVMGLIATFAIGYLVRGARAAGIPATNAMTYSGLLTDTSGTPVTGPKNILVQFYDAATAGNTLCTIGPSPITLTDGNFRVALPDECTNAAHASPSVWVDVFIDGASVGRNKLGAVPYAVEASHAVSADGVIRRIARVHGVGPNDDTDTGNVASRVLMFTKTQASTGIRVSYTDNRRSIGAGVSCRWEIKFNNASCAMPGPLVYDVYTSNTVNILRPDSVFGTCLGLAAGTYTIQVAVGPTPGYPQGDCYTGFNAQYWSLEAEEVF
jgi:hypothetical protein